MKAFLFALLIVLSSGCASASVSASYSSLTQESQEQQIKKLLTGTWKGYVKDTNWYRIGTNDRDKTLVLSGIRKEQDGDWRVSVTLNWQSPEYATLNIYGRTVTLEIMDRYGGLYILTTYSDTHLVGRLGYERGRWPVISHHEVILKKEPR